MQDIVLGLRRCLLEGSLIWLMWNYLVSFTKLIQWPFYLPTSLCPVSTCPYLINSKLETHTYAILSVGNMKMHETSSRSGRAINGSWRQDIHNQWWQKVACIKWWPRQKIYLYGYWYSKEQSLSGSPFFQLSMTDSTIFPWITVSILFCYSRLDVYLVHSSSKSSISLGFCLFCCHIVVLFYIPKELQSNLTARCMG